jgi:hypothetical protein
MKWQPSNPNKVIGGEERHRDVLPLVTLFTYYTFGQLGHASTNCPWKEKISEMVRKKARDHRATGGGG